LACNTSKTGLGHFGAVLWPAGVYNILKGEEAPYVRPASAYSLINGDDLISVKSAARPVFNVAMGIEQQLNEPEPECQHPQQPIVLRSAI
jgi:hypothetical protein